MRKSTAALIITGCILFCFDALGGTITPDLASPISASESVSLTDSLPLEATDSPNSSLGLGVPTTVEAGFGTSEAPSLTEGFSPAPNHRHPMPPLYVPDQGWTISLFGVALIVIDMLRRRTLARRRVS